jgi:ribose transport system permease protein
LSDLEHLQIKDSAPEAQLSESDEQPRRVVRRLLDLQTAWIFLLLVLMIAAFSALKPAEFATVFNFRSLAIDASVLLVIAVGMTFVIITSGIDLSVGAVLTFASIVSGKAMEAMGGDGYRPVHVGFVVALAGGVAWGILNGVLITKARVTPLIVTLGTLGMADGAGLLITHGLNIRSVPLSLTTGIGIGLFLGQIPYLVLIAAAVAAAGGIALAFTRFGRYTYAIGSNVEAARRAGVNVDRHLIKVYGLSGLLSGLAGFLSLARFSTTTIGGHSTDNLQAIAAVVIGGTSLFGGIGTIFGTVVGVFIPAILQNGFIIQGVQPYWQEIAVGAVLVAAVYLDQLKRRARQLD